MPLEPEREELRTFIDEIFRRAKVGFVSLRSFHDPGPPFWFGSSPIVRRGLLLSTAVDNAYRAANHDSPVVFCPPLATFYTQGSAEEKNVAEGLVITAELDKDPQQAREKLISILGAPTLEVMSGGRWTNSAGKAEDKLHLHWRLACPATIPAELAALKRCRELAARLVGGDPSCAPICHPVRWAGSWHRKAEPRLCKIVSRNDVEIELGAALAALNKAAAAAGISEERSRSPRSGQAGADDWAQLFGSIIEGNDLHVSTCRLAAKLAGLGVTGGAAVIIIRGILQCTTAAQDERYRARYSDIPKLVRTAVQKYGASPRDRVRDVLAEAARAGADREEFLANATCVIRGLVFGGELNKAEAESALKALSTIANKRAA
jgi:hypothetical protein